VNSGWPKEVLPNNDPAIITVVDGFDLRKEYTDKLAKKYSQNADYYMGLPCGFAVLPGNDHLWINGYCAVCKKVEE
jgi:hypothetical protein